jgi:hypothetical protein
MPVPPSIGRMASTQRVFGRTQPNRPMVKVRSLQVPVEQRFPVLFTVSVPIFWALWVASPNGGGWRRLLAGSAVLWLVAALSLVLHGVYIAAGTLHVSNFVVESGEYVAVNVIPYAGPVLLAAGLHDGLRRFVFSGGEA